MTYLGLHATVRRTTSVRIAVDKEPNMTIPELTETIEGASAVLIEISTEHTDPRLALVIAALGACAESLDRLWEDQGAK